MDSTASVHAGGATKPNGKNPSNNSTNRRGSNPTNLSGNDSGVTSPRAEPTTETLANTTSSNTVAAAGKRRPSVSSAPPAGAPRPPRGQNTANAAASFLASDKNVSLFAHLPQMTISTTSPTASITAQLLKNGKEASIHPAIIKLGLAFAEYKIMGAAERCKQMLLAFKQVRKRKRGIER